ncbi:hypothetical protein ABPG75_003280 [Micractinium tetrahymenae]
MPVRTLLFMAAAACLLVARPAVAASAVAGLEPADVWGYFADIAAIPHPSGHTEGIRAYLLDFADQQGLQSATDPAGNVYIWRPGSGGGEGAAPVVLQAHMDMVGVANDPAIDLTVTPISLVVDGDWVRADGSSLGADNGLGMAAILAVLAAPLEGPGAPPLPPLVGLFTVDEETSLSGAWGVNATLLEGASSLVNLDSEVLGQVIVGSAGGFQTYITTQAALVPAADGLVPLEAHVAGLLGGHSGLHIQDDGGNAIKMIAWVADQVLAHIPGACAVELSGGTAINAIPSEAWAVVAVPASQQGAAAAIAAQAQSDFLLEYGDREPDITISLAPLAQANATAAAHWGSAPLCLSSQGARALLGLILNLPHGVIKYSHTLEGLPETSSALTIVSPARNDSGGSPALQHTLTSYPRSSIEPELGRMLEQAQYLADAFGATLEHTWPFNPAWTFDPTSHLTNLTVQATEDVLGSADVAAVHAGLEVAILLQDLPGASAVSFGPTIQNAHSTRERVQVSLVQSFYAILQNLLATLAAEPA